MTFHSIRQTDRQTGSERGMFAGHADMVLKTIIAGIIKLYIASERGMFAGHADMHDDDISQHAIGMTF